MGNHGGAGAGRWLADPGDWVTLGVLGATYALWLLATGWLAGLWLPLGIVVAGLAVAQFSSVQHEVLHGHPFRWARLNETLVFPALAVTVPYRRFRDTHLAHHCDPLLTDPHDDPESNFLEPAVWQGLAAPVRMLLAVNNTLLGRMVLGPVIGTAVWLRGEWRLLRAGDGAVRRAWGLHLLGLVPVAGWLAWAGMPWWAYLLAVWLGQGLLKIRTFAEHRAHEAARARSVVIEDRGPLSLLFLNNNFHVVHHMHPQLPWYRLPAVYAARRDHFLRRNEGYRFASYGALFRAHLLRAKDPVAHPVWPVRRPGEPQVGGQ